MDDNTLLTADRSAAPSSEVLRAERCCRRKWYVWLPLVFLAALGALASTLGCSFLQQQVDSGIKGAVVVDGPEASGYAQFINNTNSGVPKFYVTFFNITNSEEILSDSSAKPNLVEVGPFVYAQPQLRWDVTWEPSNDTISYRQHTYIEFDREETMRLTDGRHSSDADIVITTINMLFLGMKSQVGKDYWHLICDALLWRSDHARLFEERTARELILGYEVEVKLPLIGNVFKLTFPGLMPNLPDASDPDVQEPSTIRVGATDQDASFEFTRYRGLEETKMVCPFGQIQLPFSDVCKDTPYPCCGGKEPVLVWEERGPAHGEFDQSANAVAGTDGSQFRPSLHSEHEEVVIFFDFMMRKMLMETRSGEQADYMDIPVRRFRPEFNSTWGNATERPANARYYQWGPSGLMNGTMIFTADLFLSLPHFLGCDERLLSAVSGLQPDPAKHDLYIDVEPYTGMTLAEHLRVMISARVHSVPSAIDDKPWFPSLGSRVLYMPVAWVEEENLARADSVQPLHDLLLALSVKKFVRIGGVAVAALAVCLGLLCKAFPRGCRHRSPPA
eukprot:TRINITY_DN81457_c0_g1_i1.p1 TRINITY_DN81457_c0_g1~~TRINITY_DN81457_c0_g1_i1.p1  ORF type:complete len:560 (+),score=49.15 TRINITY_DN81457_c0_g1_i1:107-1786(+)